MKYSTTFLVFAFAVGCNDAKPAATTDAAQSGTQSPTTGKPNTDETVASIREYFSGPEVGFTNVQVEKVSDPVEAPKQVVEGLGEAWVCSVTMNCNNVIGEHQQNKNWLVLINRENGHATVKDHYYSLERVENSPLGKEWFAQKGFPTPAIEQPD